MSSSFSYLFFYDRMFACLPGKHDAPRDLRSGSYMINHLFLYRHFFLRRDKRKNKKNGQMNIH